jgi:hypothetical protein
MAPGETIAMGGGQAMTTEGNFYQLRKWGDPEWKARPRRGRGAERARQRPARIASPAAPN